VEILALDGEWDRLLRNPKNRALLKMSGIGRPFEVPFGYLKSREIFGWPTQTRMRNGRIRFRSNSPSGIDMLSELNSLVAEFIFLF
jgi:hypothetical protein